MPWGNEAQLLNKRKPPNEKAEHHNKECSSWVQQLEKAGMQQQRPRAAKNK